VKLLILILRGKRVLLFLERSHEADQLGFLVIVTSKNARHCTVFSVSLHCFNALARPLSLQLKFKVSIEEKE
jgi:hypothetical protein